MLMNGLLVISFISLFFTACSTSEDIPDIPDPTVKVRAYVSCEGNFTKGTASLNVIMEDGTVQTDVFRKANGRPLGDVAQSFSIIDGKMFITLNNSEKIEVVNEEDYKSVATILYPERTISPQYIMPIDDHRAVVSDLWNAFLWVIDTKEYKVLQEIPVSTSATKQMVVADGKLFVTLAAKKIAVISLSSLEVIKELDIPVVGDSKLLKDKNGLIWALACGFDDDPESIIPRTITSLNGIDPVTMEAVKTIKFSSGYTVSRFGARMDINQAKDKLYLNVIHDGKEGIYAFPIDGEQLPEEPLFVYSDKVELLYNMAVSPEETIFICDALDYRQRGWVYEFDLNGNRLNEYRIGIVPQYIVFK